MWCPAETKAPASGALSPASAAGGGDVRQILSTAGNADQHQQHQQASGGEGAGSSRKLSGIAAAQDYGDASKLDPAVGSGSDVGGGSYYAAAAYRGSQRLGLKQEERMFHLPQQQQHQGVAAPYFQQQQQLMQHTPMGVASCGPILISPPLLSTASSPGAAAAGGGLATSSGSSSVRVGALANFSAAISYDVQQQQQQRYYPHVKPPSAPPSSLPMTSATMFSSKRHRTVSAFAPSPLMGEPEASMPFRQDTMILSSGSGGGGVGGRGGGGGGEGRSGIGLDIGSNDSRSTSVGIGVSGSNVDSGVGGVGSMLPSVMGIGGQWDGPGVGVGGEAGGGVLEGGGGLVGPSSRPRLPPFSQLLGNVLRPGHSGQGSPSTASKTTQANDEVQQQQQQHGYPATLRVHPGTVHSSYTGRSALLGGGERAPVADVRVAGAAAAEVDAAGDGGLATSEGSRKRERSGSPGMPESGGGGGGSFDLLLHGQSPRYRRLGCHAEGCGEPAVVMVSGTGDGLTTGK